MEKFEPKANHTEELKKFIYRDNSAGGKIVFECLAKGILEADRLYQEKTGKNPEKQNYIGCSSEKIKSREVFTDDLDIIGEKDNIDYLEALPISCAIITLAKPERKIAGMLHLSLNLENGITEDLINQLKYRLKSYGLKISDCQIRLFNAGDIISAGIKVALSSHQINMPRSEILEKPGVKINKNTGEVSFFSLFPDKFPEQE
ncbi:MAG: hypothetical protein WC310_02450 [Patescibacteria group bacterium]|jgi:hypothetical protein